MTPGILTSSFRFTLTSASVLTLTATTDQLTREDAVRALGDKAKNFNIRTLTLVRAANPSLTRR